VQSNCSARPRNRLATGLGAIALSITVGVHADETHERQLDQQVQELRRQLDAQSRRIDQLERGLRTSDSIAQFETGKSPPPSDTSARRCHAWTTIGPFLGWVVSLFEAITTTALSPATLRRAPNGTSIGSSDGGRGKGSPAR